jgi:hypothetical protein
MRRALILLPLLLAFAGPTAAGASSAPASVRTVATGTTSTDLASAQFARFGRSGGGFGRRSFFGGSRGRGGGLFGSRSRGRGRSRGLFSRIARALAFAYVLHLLFSHGGLSILVWIGLIALIVSFARRRRRRRLAY